MALMNMVSSNINQWTLLAAMLPITYSLSRGAVSAIPLDGSRKLELALTLGQSLLGLLFLVDMELEWWEAAGLFVLWAVQFAFSPVPPVGIAVHFIRHPCLSGLGGGGIGPHGGAAARARGGSSKFANHVEQRTCAV